jgi:hypothetical protein
VTTEDALRERVWKLRPALKDAISALRDVYPSYEQHHEGAEIWRVIEIGERALSETAGSTRQQAALGAQSPSQPEEVG